MREKKTLMEENVLFDIKCRTFKVIGSFARGKSRKTWNEIIRSDVKGTKVSKDPAKDRNVLKFFIRKRQIRAKWKTDVITNMMIMIIL